MKRYIFCLLVVCCLNARKVKLLNDTKSTYYATVNERGYLLEPGKEANFRLPAPSWWRKWWTEASIYIHKHLGEGKFIDAFTIKPVVKEGETTTILISDIQRYVRNIKHPFSVKTSKNIVVGKKPTSITNKK